MRFDDERERRQTMEPINPGMNILSPRILVSELAVKKMQFYVDLCNLEIGWLGTVRRIGNTFHIDDVMLFDQVVTAVSTEITPESLSQFGSEIIKKDQKIGVETLNNLRFWGHSHVNMSTSPSAQDDFQMAVFDQPGVEWFVRGIGNKKGDLKFDVFFFRMGIKILNVPWTIDEIVDTKMRNEIKMEIESKVKSGGSWAYGGGWPPRSNSKVHLKGRFAESSGEPPTP